MKNTFLKIVSMLLCFVMLASLFACNGKKADGDPTGDGNTDTENNGENNNENNGENNGENGGNSNTEEKPDDNLPTELTVKEFLKTLTSTPYTANIVADKKVGLTDSTIVGIDKESFDDVLYPVPADADCAHVIDVSEYRITPELEDCSDLLATLLIDLKEMEGLKKVVFPAGVYKFSKTIIISDLKDVYFCSSSETECFEIRMTDWVVGVTADKCENIHFNNIEFDYEVPPIVAGDVVSSDEKAKTVVIDIYDEFDMTDPRFNGGKINSGSYIEYKYDEITGKYVPNLYGNILTGKNSIPDGSYDASTGYLTLKLNSTVFPEAGTKVCVAYTEYGKNAFNVSNSKNVYFEDVSVYTAGGMTLVVSGDENVYLNRFKLTIREGSRLLMNATADGFHSVNCLGEIVITNSIFTNSHDDCMNIKSWYGKVEKAVGKEMTFVNDKSRYPVIADVGDTIEFYNPVDFAFIGEYTVAEVDEGTRTYTFTKIIDADLGGAIFCTGAKSPKLTVKNCFLGNKSNRGMLVQCREVEISNCTFQNIAQGPIQIFSVMNQFNEGIMPRNVVVKNNKFIGNARHDIGVFVWGTGGTVKEGVLKGVTITNNYFANCYDQTPVWLLGAAETTVSDNLYYNVGSGIDPHSDDYSIMIIKDCTKITVNNNFIYFDSEAKGFEAIRKTGNNNVDVKIGLTKITVLKD